MTTRPAGDDDQADLSVYLGSLLKQIEEGEQTAIEELRGFLSGGMRFLIARQIPASRVDDVLCKALLGIFSEIQAGNARRPDAFLGMVRIIIRRHIARDIEVSVSPHTKEKIDRHWTVRLQRRNATNTTDWQEQVSLMRTVLTELSSRDQEALGRFYRNPQTEDEICESMNLRTIEFRLLRSKARSRFAELDQSRLYKKTSLPDLTRTA